MRSIAVELVLADTVRPLSGHLLVADRSLGRRVHKSYIQTPHLAPSTIQDYKACQFNRRKKYNRLSSNKSACFPFQSQNHHVEYTSPHFHRNLGLPHDHGFQAHPITQNELHLKKGTKISSYEAVNEIMTC